MTIRESPASGPQSALQSRAERGGWPVEASDECAYNRFMDLPAGFSRAPKPPKSFTRSELIRSIYERFQRNRAEQEGPSAGVRNTRSGRTRGRDGAIYEKGE